MLILRNYYKIWNYASHKFHHYLSSPSNATKVQSYQYFKMKTMTKYNAIHILYTIIFLGHHPSRSSSGQFH